MIRSQLRPILHQDHAGLVGVVPVSLRQFSVFQPKASDNEPQSPGMPWPPVSFFFFFLFFFKYRIYPYLVTGNGANIRPRGYTAPPRGPMTRANYAGNPQQRVYTPRPRPERGLDARSLGARQADGQPVNILRAPNFRSPRIARPTSFRKPMKPAANKQKAPRRARGRQPSEEEEGDEGRLQDVNSVYRELYEKNKPVPVRYDPQHPEFATLKDTWPCLPTDSTASAVSVSERLSWLSGRVANGYEPPHELGKRLFDGKSVSFSSEEEKAQAIEAAQKLAQQQADKLTQEKGDLVEPVDISFQPINAEDQKTLIRTLVQGDYSEREPLPANKPPVFGQIMTTLGNNETYRTPGKSSQFLDKVDSLLSARRPAAAKRG